MKWGRGIIERRGQQLLPTHAHKEKHQISLISTIITYLTDGAYQLFDFLKESFQHQIQTGRSNLPVYLMFSSRFSLIVSSNCQR